MSKKYISIVAFILFSLLAIAFGRWGGEISARKSVQEAMQSLGAPTGFKGAIWLMDREEVSRSVPDLTSDRNGNLVGVMEAYGRPARVTFWFQNGHFMMVIINFASISQGSFLETQRLLESQYGRFETNKEEDAKGWVKRWPRLVFKHNIRNLNNNLIEQIQFYRST